MHPLVDLHHQLQHIVTAADIMLRLKCKAMDYAWGRLADSSEVCK